MTSNLPQLIYEDIVPTRDYLRDVALTLGALQRVFLPPDPHDWQHGLLISERGLTTQEFSCQGEVYQAILNLEKGSIELGSTSWQLTDFSASELHNNVQVWLESRGISTPLEKPTFMTKSVSFDSTVAQHLNWVLWWHSLQFRIIKAKQTTGLTSPILLYPHHFDVSLVSFPHNDTRQLAIGFSTGDDVIHEPYVYITAYPEPKELLQLELGRPAYWQSSGFHAAILTYGALHLSANPEALLQTFTTQTLALLNPLLG